MSLSSTQSRVATYLNFPRSTEEAFNFYKSVFGGEFEGGIKRFAEVPEQPGQPPMAEADKNLVMHVGLKILGSHMIYGTDAPESMGFKCVGGNNMYICIDPETRAEADRIFAALSAGGKVEMPMTDMYWGDYFGSFTDKYAIQWMINCTAKN